MHVAYQARGVAQVCNAIEASELSPSWSCGQEFHLRVAELLSITAVRPLCERCMVLTQVTEIALARLDKFGTASHSQKLSGDNFTRRGGCALEPSS